ncbi:hypothetical protein MANI_015082 [Metarhizium anisopliae]|nr:hypothetical protein MANI_015082 [Metarhizium anisopliae]
MPQTAKGIIKLQSTISVRPDTNHTTVDREGVMYTRQVMLDLIRDNKIHWDSLANLPTLADLLNNRQAWKHFSTNCNNLDVYCRAVRCVAEQDEEGKGKKSFLRSRFDGGMPDTAEELQPSGDTVAGIPSYDIKSAIMFHVGLTMKGWGAVEKPAGKQCNLTERDDAFW